MSTKQNYSLLVALGCFLLGSVVQAADEKDAVGYWKIAGENSVSVSLYANGKVDLEFDRVGENLYASGNWELSQGRIVVSLQVDYWGLANETFYTRPPNPEKEAGPTPFELVLVVKNDQKLKVTSYKAPEFKGRSYKVDLKKKALSRDGQTRPQERPEGNG